MAKKPTAVKFTGEVKHDGTGGLIRFPAAVVGFEDPAHADYFVKAGWAEPSKDDPIITYAADELSIDPDTRSNETGLKVMDAVSTVEG